MKHDRTIKLEKTRADGRRRSKEHRAREREATKRFAGEPDKVVCRNVWLQRSEIARVVAEMHLEPDADEFLSLAELKKLDGKALAEVVRWALKALRARR